MLPHFNKYLEYNQKYKIKYQKLKTQYKNQVGGKPLGFYINLNLVKPKTIFAHPKLEYQILNTYIVNVESNRDIKYNSKKYLTVKKNIM